MAPDPDQDLIRCLDSVHQLLSLRHSLSLLLRQGWMDMARARYSMGPSRVSHPLFSLKPHSASALLSLAPSPDENDFPSHMTLVRLDTGENNSHSASDSDSHTSGEEEQGFPQELTRSKAVATDWSQDEDAAYRRLMGGVNDSHSDSESAASIQANEQTRPLRWFGALVSPHLQAAQTSFKTALEILVNIANAQGEALDAHKRLMQQCGDILEAQQVTSETTDVL